jgi:DUF971 family protein
MTDTNGAWPTELKVADKGRVLKVSFDNGDAFELPAEYLRVMSPSAEVQGHSRKVLGGKRHVAIIGVDPIGTYAVKLRFDDMHASGIYSWSYLRELGAAQDEKWAAYVSELESKGLTRDRPGETVAGDNWKAT